LIKQWTDEARIWRRSIRDKLQNEVFDVNIIAARNKISETCKMIREEMAIDEVAMNDAFNQTWMLGKKLDRVADKLKSS
jgi:hypothetical protein